MTEARLEIVYFESAAGRGSFAWLDGAEDKGKEIHRRFTDIITTASVDEETPHGRVVLSGERVLVETTATVREASRPIRVSVVVHAPRRDPDLLVPVAREAAAVLDRVGVELDAEQLGHILAHRRGRDAGQRAGLPGRTAWVVVFAVAFGVLIVIFKFLRWLLR